MSGIKFKARVHVLANPELSHAIGFIHCIITIGHFAERKFQVLRISKRDNNLCEFMREISA